MRGRKHDSDNLNMRMLILLIFYCFSFELCAQTSRIDWKNISPKSWLNFQLWKEENELSQSVSGTWQRESLNKKKREFMGRVIKCVHSCSRFRDFGQSQIQYKSSVFEGDDIATGSDSYLWVFLIDGTLVRLAPNSSITFREVNISKDEIYFHARVNFGNILWHSRKSFKLKEYNKRETDILFSNLKIKETKIESDNNDDLVYFGESNKVLKRVRKFNELLEINKDFTPPKSNQLIAFPNGSLEGSDLNFELISLVGGKSYFKNKPLSEYSYDSEDELNDLRFHYRGYNKTETFNVEQGTWYEVNYRGSEIQPFEKPEEFMMGELITRRFPTILIAREVFIQRYSKNILNNITLESMENNKYRLWGNMKYEGEVDLLKRKNFLIEFTRRLETTAISSAVKFKRKMKKKGVSVRSSKYSIDFYSYAMDKYFQVQN